MSEPEHAETDDPEGAAQQAGIAPIRMSHRWSVDDEIIAFNYDLDQRCRRSLRRLALLIVVPCLIGFLAIDIVRLKLSVLSIVVIPFLVAFIVRWSVGPSTERHELRKKYARSPLADTVVNWEIDAETLSVNWSDRLLASFTWDLVDKAVQSSEGMLLYVRGQHWWIPAHCFESDADRQRFLELAQKNVTHYRRTGAVYKPVE